MAEMEQEEMAEMQEQAGEGQKAPITELIKQGGQVLSQLAQAIGQSQATTPEDQQAMQQIMELYADLVERQLSAAPGANPEPKVPGPKEIPMEGQGTPMGPQMRQ